VYTFELGADQVQGLRVIRNPDKLGYLLRQTHTLGPGLLLPVSGPAPAAPPA